MKKLKPTLFCLTLAFGGTAGAATRYELNSFQIVLESSKQRTCFSPKISPEGQTFKTFSLLRNGKRIARATVSLADGVSKLPFANRDQLKPLGFFKYFSNKKLLKTALTRFRDIQQRSQDEVYTRIDVKPLPRTREVRDGLVVETAFDGHHVPQVPLGVLDQTECEGVDQGRIPASTGGEAYSVPTLKGRNPAATQSAYGAVWAESSSPFGRTRSSTNLTGQ